MLTDEEIYSHLVAEKSLEERCSALVQHANARGGVDNITVILLDFEAEQAIPNTDT